jgi:hypothetical protein
MTLATGGPDDRLYLGEFSEDLTKGVARATTYPGVPDNVATVQNLLLREDLLTSGFGRYQLLTDSSVPIPVQGPRRGMTPSIYRPYFIGASADFGHIVFQSTLNLTPEATGDFQKLYEWDHGNVRLVGVLPDGSLSSSSVAGRNMAGSNQNHVEGIVSDDGSRIYFTVQEVPGRAGISGTPAGQLYLRENASATVHVNASERANALPGSSLPAQFWTASANGMRAFFTTEEQLVDEDRNGVADLYRFDAEAPVGERLTLLSVDGEPDDGTGGATTSAMGANQDGERVYFAVDNNQLVDGAPVADNAQQFLYLWAGGDVKYVGRVDRADVDALSGGELTSKTSRVTPDGAYFAFLTRDGNQSVARDHGVCDGLPCKQLYVYSVEADGGAGELSCVSCPPDGSPASSFSVIDFDFAIGAAAGTSHQNRIVTDDGRRVYFSTSQALVDDDHNTVYDAYQYTVATGKLDLISTGRAGADHSFFMDASASGNDVFFTTRERLVGWDGDQSVDLYDARVGGGFPEPVIKQPCQGDACQGPASGAPEFQRPASVTFHGAGNVSASRVKGR